MEDRIKHLEEENKYLVRMLHMYQFAWGTAKPALMNIAGINKCGNAETLEQAREIATQTLQKVKKDAPKWLKTDIHVIV